MFSKHRLAAVPSDFQANEKLAHYVYEYLLFSGAQKAAQMFLQEVGLDRTTQPNEAPGFLFSWWSVFWDLYCAAPERRDILKHSTDARQFHDLGILHQGYIPGAPQAPHAGQLIPPGLPPQHFFASGAPMTVRNSGPFGGPTGPSVPQQFMQMGPGGRPMFPPNLGPRFQSVHPASLGDVKMTAGGFPAMDQLHPHQPLSQRQTTGMANADPFPMNPSSAAFRQQQVLNTTNQGNNSNNSSATGIPSLPISSQPTVTLRHQPHQQRTPGLNGNGVDVKSASPVTVNGCGGGGDPAVAQFQHHQFLLRGQQQPQQQVFQQQRSANAKLGVSPRRMPNGEMSPSHAQWTGQSLGRQFSHPGFNFPPNPLVAANGLPPAASPHPQFLPDGMNTNNNPLFSSTTTPNSFDQSDGQPPLLEPANVCGQTPSQMSQLLSPSPAGPPDSRRQSISSGNGGAGGGGQRLAPRSVEEALFATEDMDMADGEANGGQLSQMWIGQGGENQVFDDGFVLQNGFVDDAGGCFRE